MKVNFYATLRPLVGGKTVEFPLAEGSTVRELIAEIIRRYPTLGSQLLDEDGELYGYVHVFINGRDAPYLEHRLETVLTPDDTVDIFPAVAGG